VVALGFEGGNVLEPGCGTGLFMAASPTPVAKKSFFSGIEADLITARISTLLYPLGISIRVLDDEAGHPRSITDEEAKAYRAAAIVHVEHI
jgi:hypothetical protein